MALPFDAGMSAPDDRRAADGDRVDARVDHQVDVATQRHSGPETN